MTSAVDRDIAAGSLALQRGDFVRSLSLFSKAIAVTPTPALLDIRALIYTKMGRIDEALNDANSIVRASPGIAVVSLLLRMGYLRVATIFRKRDMTEAAFKICRIGVGKIKPDDPDRKALEGVYKDLAAKLGITLKRQQKKIVPPVVPRQNKIGLESQAEPAPTELDEPAVAPLPPPLPTIVHNFGTHSIPFEIIQHIFELLPLKDITKCLRLSSPIRAMLSNNKFLWRDLNLSKYANKVTDATIQSLMLRGRDQVRSVVLHDCTKVTKTGLRAISNSKSKLHTFELAFNRKATPESIVVTVRASSGDSIRRINVSGTGINDEGLGLLLEKCRGLEELVLSECTQLTDAALDSVIKSVMSHKQLQATARTTPTPAFFLKLLDVSGNTQLSDKFGCNAARCFPNLESVNFSKLELVTNRSLESIALHCKTMLHIDATSVSFTSVQAGGNTLNTSMLLLAKECKGIKSVRIGACKFVSDAAINTLTALCRDLEVLEFPKSANLTDAALQKIGLRCKSLTKLNLSFCPQISDTGIETFMKTQTESNQLVCVDFSNNQRVTDKTMHLLCTYGKNVVELNVSGCNLTGEGVLAFAKMKATKGRGAPLAVLNIDRCANVGNATVTAVRAMLPRSRVMANLV
ncbi:hypothetical protein HDU98_007982 [Podochytrium sp. JEL0797]|nr:hypothetical protein HDU98_007982 [Podochytrium sp. JEL0797]